MQLPHVARCTCSAVISLYLLHSMFYALTRRVWSWIRSASEVTVVAVVYLLLLLLLHGLGLCLQNVSSNYFCLIINLRTRLPLLLLIVVGLLLSISLLQLNFLLLSAFLSGILAVLYSLLLSFLFIFSTPTFSDWHIIYKNIYTMCICINIHK